ncbi:MAG TPA: membrane protein insertase YidC [Kofleriaceae bacterium]
MLAVALALGVILVWNQFAHKDEPPASKTGSAQTGSAAVTPAGPAVGISGSAAPVPEAATPRGPEQTISLPFKNVVATFSDYCGGLKGWKLTDPRYERDSTKGEILPANDAFTVSDGKGGHLPIEADKKKSLPDCGAFDVNFASSTFVIPRHAVWKGEKISDTEVRYTYRDANLTVEKAFSIIPDKYLVRMVVKSTVNVPAGTDARQQLAISAYAYQDPEALKDGSSRIAPRAWSSATMRGGELVETDVKGVLEGARTEHAVTWAGFDHPFLLSAYAPALRENELVEKHTSASRGDNGMPNGFMQSYLLYPQVVMHHGDQPINKEIVGYLGPKNFDDLAAADQTAGFPTGFNKVIDLGWFWFVGKPLLWLLQHIYFVVGNWGVAIILLTFVVKLATLYWTTKSMRSMKSMAALAPQMKALQTKYADDKQRQQAETMALYKTHGVNPVAGCLPMVLQMPIWIALYRMLGSAGELYQQPFIHGWIDDLTATDPFYVLPVMLVITMFLQVRLQPQAVDSQQQKFMQYGMPLMFGAFSFVAPAGLTIYMFTNTILSAVHSVYMNKFDKKSLAAAAQLQKNKEALAATDAKGGAKSAKAVAPRVIDAKATDVSDESDDADDVDDAPSATSGAARNRPRRKKRKK